MEQPSRSSLRKVLDKILATESDLEAFCVDHFQNIKRLFSSGMDRTRMVSILLEHVEPEDIVIALEENYSEAFARYKNLLRNSEIKWSDSALGATSKHLGTDRGYLSICAEKHGNIEGSCEIENHENTILDWHRATQYLKPELTGTMCVKNLLKSILVFS